MTATASETETATDAEETAGADTTMFGLAIDLGRGRHHPDEDATADHGQDQGQGLRRGTAEGPPGETGVAAESDTRQISGGATINRNTGVQLHSCGPRVHVSGGI